MKRLRQGIIRTDIVLGFDVPQMIKDLKLIPFGLSGAQA
jgi:hypothetical protein